MTSYTQALFAVATGAEMEVTELPTVADAGEWLCCFWKEMIDAMRDEGTVVSVPMRPTRQGVDAVVDEIFRHTVFQQTLSNATDIIDHITLSYLPALAEGPPAFRSLWDHVIVPAWHHHAAVHRLITTTESK